ncbi:TPA: hypothetical protein ACXK4S_000697 [Pseudomonas aeruginosa]
MQNLTDKVNKLVDVMFMENIASNTKYKTWNHQDVLKATDLEYSPENLSLACRIVGNAKSIESKVGSYEVANIMKEAANNLYDDDVADYYFSKVDFMLEEKMNQKPSVQPKHSPKLTY